MRSVTVVDRLALEEAAAGSDYQWHSERIQTFYVQDDLRGPYYGPITVRSGNDVPSFESVPWAHVIPSVTHRVQISYRLAKPRTVSVKRCARSLMMTFGTPMHDESRRPGT